ncbi:hypothetical protein SCG7109_AX_00010, partial [Chlamydiales bacterium SCGC AG-110-M15]
VYRKLSKIEGYEGKTQYIEYYGLRCPNPVMGKNINIQKWGDPRLGRVRRVLEPVGPNGKLVPVAQFIYDLKVDKRSEYHSYAHGTTEFYDARGKRTDYQYDKDLRLNKIIHFDLNKDKKNYHAIRSQVFYWGKRDSHDLGNLISLAEVDRKGRARKVSHYVYDERGNVLKEILYGNLTGNGPQIFKLNTDGIPDKSVERKTTSYTYSDKERNLPLSKREEGSVITETTYKTGTSLPQSSIIRDKSRIHQRIFYEYDSENLLKTVITDNGTERSKKSLRNVTQRRIRRLQYRKDKLQENKAGIYGLISHESENYLDASTNKEILVKRTNFQYDSKGNLKNKQVFDAKNRLWFQRTFSYDAKNRKVKEVDSRGKTWEWKYDKRGNLIFEKGPRKDIHKTYSYDHVSRRILEQTHTPEGIKKQQFVYDAQGHITKEVDIFHNATHYRYDVRGRLISIQYPSVSHPKTTKAWNIVETNEYDAFDNIIKHTDGDSNITRYAYTSLDELMTQKFPDDSTEEFRYSLRAAVLKKKERNDTWVSFKRDWKDRAIETTILSTDLVPMKKSIQTWGTFSLLQEIDPAGKCLNYYYDNLGRLIEKSEEDHFESYEYNHKNLLHREIKRCNEQSLATTYTYDAWERKIDEKVMGDDGRVQFQQSWSYTIDDLERTSTLYGEHGPETSLKEWDCEGRLKRFTDPLGNKWTKKYSSTSNPLAKKASRLVIDTTDPHGKVSRTIYDPKGRVAEKLELYLSKVLDRKIFFYNAQDKCCRQIHKVYEGEEARQEKETSWSWEPTGEIACITEGTGKDRRETHYTYDKGLLQTIKKPNGILLHHTYDTLARLISLNSSDQTVETSYVYDILDRPILVKTPDTCVEREFNSFGDLLSESAIDGQKVRYTYDSFSRIVKLVFSDESSVRYDYDGMHLREVSRWDASGSLLASHTFTSYDLAGRLLSEITADGEELSRTYDSRGICRASSTKGISWAIPEGGVDALGNILSLEEKGPLGKLNSNYTYSRLYQISSEEGAFSHQYSHDSRENRIAVDNVPSSVNDLDALEGDAFSQYTYDSCGNLIERVRGDERVFFSYDALNRLSEVILEKNNEKYKVVYTVDAFHRRSSSVQYQWNSSEALWQELSRKTYLYADDKDIGSVNENGVFNEFRVLVLGSSETGNTLFIEKDGKYYVPFHDCRGSIQALRDRDGLELLDYNRYSSYGEQERYLSNHLDQPWQYRGKRLDDLTGLVHFGRRDYDPQMGRWISPDPIFFDDGPNRYHYLHNNPFHYYDPNGLTAMEFAEGFAKSALLGVGTAIVATGVGIAVAATVPVTAPFIFAGMAYTSYAVTAYVTYNVYAENKDEIRSVVNTYQREGLGAACTETGSYIAAIPDETKGEIVGAYCVPFAISKFMRYSGKFHFKKKVEVPKEEVGQSNGFLGHKGWELKNTTYQKIRNRDQIINKENYGGHALDQMQGRGITPSVVENVLKEGIVSLDPIAGRLRHYDSANNITVITELNKIITVIPGKR